MEDRIRFEPRIPILSPVYSVMFRTVFRYRHWKLRRLFSSKTV